MYTIRKDKLNKYVIVNTKTKNFWIYNKRLKLDIEYKNFLIKEKNGFLIKIGESYYNEVYFHNLKEAREAKKWLETLTVLEEMIKYN